MPRLIDSLCGAIVTAAVVAPTPVEAQLANVPNGVRARIAEIGSLLTPDLITGTFDLFRPRSREPGNQMPVPSGSSAGRVETGVIWTGLVNVTANGNSLQKTGGCDGCPDAGAISQEKISSGGGYMQFTASETSTLRGIGFSTGHAGTSPNEIKFAILLQPGGIAEIRESGRYRTDTPFVPGDVFKIAVKSGVVRYYKKGRLIYRSSVPAEYPLLVGAALLSLYSTINNVVLDKTP